MKKLRTFRLDDEDMLKLDRIAKKLKMNKSEALRYLIRENYLSFFDERVKNLAKFVERVMYELSEKVKSK